MARNYFNGFSEKLRRQKSQQNILACVNTFRYSIIVFIHILKINRCQKRYERLFPHAFKMLFINYYKISLFSSLSLIFFHRFNSLSVTKRNTTRFMAVQDLNLHTSTRPAPIITLTIWMTGTLVLIMLRLMRLNFRFKDQYMNGFQKLLLSAIHVMTKSTAGGIWKQV